MKADFSGWATKAGLKCSDGRTIMPDAFKHQDQVQVPLVWQHGHKDLENVLGHVLLTNRAEGVWCDAFFNNSDKAAKARELVQHKDINALSIWANNLVEQSKRVLHGAIREVSLVLSGANPGALIEPVTIRHSDDDLEILDDEAIIYTGLELQHADGGSDTGNDGEETVQDVYDSLSEKQKQVVHFMIGEALASAGDGSMGQSGLELDDDATPQDIYDSMTDQQKELVHHMVGEALGDAENGNSNDDNNDHQEGNDIMHRNVFEKKDGDKNPAPILSHADVEGIVADATKSGSLKSAVEAYALAHGIEDIDILFPDARAIDNTPELFGRRVEWVASFLGAVKKSPFSRIKTLNADITVAEARAKGYIKGNLKKEEFFKVAKRVTQPTTIYKKQKLDRDDMVDITDFDVVTWLKGEMRLMLDEELARAALVGDGRAVDDEDRIDSDAIRPIAFDHELYTSVLNINIDDASSSMGELTDALILNRGLLRGSGMPTMYTTETYIGRLLTQKDGMQRRMYKSLDEVASELRVKEIVPVEVLEEYPEIVAILVNPQDYTIGADQGGNIAMFDDFDIDYNQYKYLIETRCSGSLTKLKSALVVKKVAGTDVRVTPAMPDFTDNEITITDQTGVVYRNAGDDSTMDASGSPYTVAEGESITVQAEPDTGYYFDSSEGDSWIFTGTA